MVKVGSLVRRRVNETGQKYDELGVVVANVTLGNIRFYEDWSWVLFGGRKYRIFREDLEEVK